MSYIDPLDLNFGNMVVESSIQKEIYVKNFTQCHIAVKIEVSVNYPAQYFIIV